MIEFCYRNASDKNIWQCITNYYQKNPISFETALRGLQALVKENCIGVAFGRFGTTVVYYRFPPNSTHYRIRNIRTDEEIYGDILT